MTHVYQTLAMKEHVHQLSQMKMATYAFALLAILARTAKPVIPITVSLSFAILSHYAYDIFTGKIRD